MLEKVTNVLKLAEKYQRVIAWGINVVISHHYSNELKSEWIPCDSSNSSYWLLLKQVQLKKPYPDSNLVIKLSFL